MNDISEDKLYVGIYLVNSVICKANVINAGYTVKQEVTNTRIGKSPSAEVISAAEHRLLRLVGTLGIEFLRKHRIGSRKVRIYACLLSENGDRLLDSDDSSSVSSDKVTSL